MKYLIDTHVLLWIITEDKKLSDIVKQIYLNSENEIFFSLACIWEMAIKISLGKIFIDQPLDKFIDKYIKGSNIEILMIDLQDVIKIETLPFFHRDPFDRLIIAQSIEKDIPILSSDSIFDAYTVKRIW
ncbi:MAG: type II toxin-antitoxin system VapC family toxin [Candidatus Latescibacteria bacterium]|nr:type II toxin-antitoxin system VapC family toxin [Candidatus Latescibacterota bacterium]